MFNELIDGKLCLSQKVKVEQVFVFDWKEGGTSIAEEEEGEIYILDLYQLFLTLKRNTKHFKLFFSCFDYLLFTPPPPKRLAMDI